MILIPEEFSADVDKYFNIVDLGTEEVLIRYRQKLYEIRKLPAQMTIEELRAEVMQATEELDNRKGISHDELFKDMESW
ncbi:MAG: hypothetical protein LBT43_13630 [Prevotella sp.]|jgi:hypothetical protein|nr:hypothetical protein [Prevotella sp.]